MPMGIHTTGFAQVDLNQNLPQALRAIIPDD